MQYGYCMDVNFLKGDAMSQAIFDGVAKAQFDYVELPLYTLSALSTDEVAQLKKALQVIPCKACNIFFPFSLSIVGPNMDMDGIRAYLGRMLPMVADMGVETLVFGNGGARKIPEGESRESIWQNLRTIVELMDEHAVKTGITISVEPLNSRESNIINSYSEAVALTKGLTNVATMIDSYHVAADAQTYDDVYQHPQALRHIHIAYADGRMVPSSGDNKALYADFVHMVKSLGYNGKVSIEGGLRATDPMGIAAEIKDSLQALKSLLA